MAGARAREGRGDDVSVMADMEGGGAQSGLEVIGDVGEPSVPASVDASLHAGESRDRGKDSQGLADAVMGGEDPRDVGEEVDVVPLPSRRDNEQREEGGPALHEEGRRGVGTARGDRSVHAAAARGDPSVHAAAAGDPQEDVDAHSVPANVAVVLLSGSEEANEPEVPAGGTAPLHDGAEDPPGLLRVVELPSRADGRDPAVVAIEESPRIVAALGIIESLLGAHDSAANVPAMSVVDAVGEAPISLAAAPVGGDGACLGRPASPPGAAAPGSSGAGSRGRDHSSTSPSSTVSSVSTALLRLSDDGSGALVDFSDDEMLTMLCERVTQLARHLHLVERRLAQLSHRAA